MVLAQARTQRRFLPVSLEKSQLLGDLRPDNGPSRPSIEQREYLKALDRHSNMHAGS
jgi:hypothetical protein